MKYSLRTLLPNQLVKPSIGFSTPKGSKFPTGCFQSSLIKSELNADFNPYERGRISLRINEDHTGETIERYSMCNSFIKTTFAWERSQNDLILSNVKHFQKCDADNYAFAGRGSDRKMQFLKIDQDELIIESAFRADIVFLDRNQQKLRQF